MGQTSAPAEKGAKRVRRASPKDAEAGGRYPRLDIEGDVEGAISGRTITVHEGASVTGSLGARSVVIRGQVSGVVQAGVIAVGSTARIRGELWYETLSIDQGADVEARLVPAAASAVPLRRRRAD